MKVALSTAGKDKVDVTGMNENPKQTDSGRYPKNRPWYGYVRLQDKKPGGPKGGEQ